MRCAGSNQMVPQRQMIGCGTITVDFEAQLVGKTGPLYIKLLPANIEMTSRKIAHILVDGTVCCITHDRN